MKSMPLGPHSEGAAGLYDIPKTHGRWHVMKLQLKRVFKQRRELCRR